MARARAIWVNRRILRILIIRDLKVRYSDSVLGFAWTMLDPLLLTLVYWFVFGVIVARGEPSEQPYILWLLTGILPFQWTAHVLGDSGRLLGNDAKLVTSSSLPREIWVLRSVSSRFIEFLFTLPITVVFVLFFMVFTDRRCLRYLVGVCPSGGLRRAVPVQRRAGPDAVAPVHALPRHPPDRPGLHDALSLPVTGHLRARHPRRR